MANNPELPVDEEAVITVDCNEQHDGNNGQQILSDMTRDFNVTTSAVVVMDETAADTDNRLHPSIHLPAATTTTTTTTIEEGEEEDDEDEVDGIPRTRPGAFRYPEFLTNGNVASDFSDVDDESPSVSMPVATEVTLYDSLSTVYSEIMDHILFNIPLAEPTTDEQLTYDKLVARSARVRKTLKFQSIALCAFFGFWWHIIPTDTETPNVEIDRVELGCPYVQARYSNCLRGLLSSDTCNACVKNALEQQQNQDPKSCGVFEDLYSSTCSESCPNKCVVAIEALAHCKMEEYDGCTIRSVPEWTTFQLAPNQSSFAINNNNNNNNNSVSINNVGIDVHNKTIDENASIAYLDSDNDGVEDYKDYCPGTEFTPRQQQQLAEEGNNLTVVDQYGCPLLHCSFSVKGRFMGIYAGGRIARAPHEVVFEVVECLDEDRKADCVVEDNERCVSIRLHNDTNLYWYHYEGGLYLNRANPMEPFSCKQASFCMSPGLRNTFTDRSTASFRPVYRSEYLFAGANSSGAVTVQSKGKSASWSFQCGHGIDKDDLWAILLHGNHSTEHGLTPPTHVQCVGQV